MSRKLYDKSEPEKTALPYADLQSVENRTLKSSRNKQKQVNFSGESEDDELVKYMSNLPGYLERGKNIHEKVLNVGVLDWSRLEQWQHRHKHIPQKVKRTSTSTSDSNASSSVPAEGSSDHSGSSCSPSASCQKVSRPSLQSYFKASTMQDHSLGDKTAGENVGNCHNLRSSLGNITAQSKLVRADEYASQNHVRRLKTRSKKDLHPDIISMEGEVLPSDKKCEGTSCAKLEKGTQDSELEKRMETLQEPDVKAVEQGVLGKSKPMDLPLPNRKPQNSHFGVSDTRTSFGQKSGTTKRTNFSGKSKEFFLKDLNCDTLHSCPLPDDIEANHSQEEGSSSLDGGNIRISTATSAPLSSERGTSPSRSRKGEERKQTGAAISIENGPSQGLDQKGKSEKSRSSSPFGRFGITKGYTSKVSSCKESLHVPHKSSIPAIRSGSETVSVSASSCISGRNSSVDAARSRTSPLRRLLDPLLKPKEANRRHSVELSQQDPGLINNANAAYPHLQSAKELYRDRRVSCSSINTCDSYSEKKPVSSTVRTLLRTAVKNGRPLFTFAVDNDNILVATVKTLSTSGKDDCCCVYTFFSVREVKKKNGSWMNQAGKSKGPNCIHQAVAQMKVSDSHLYDLTGQNCVDFSTVKEFVLFSVQLKQGNGEASDYQPNDELAAIVLKIPKAINFINNLHQGSCRNDSQLVQATVVLPSGVHSLPSRGGPSSLIERWKSGGSCDCGGWDLGCKLKILENENEACKNSKPSKAYFAEQFELFLQVNGQDHVPAFSLTPITHGIYSVAFDSSLSLLQAFSVSIALIDSKMPYELSGSRNSVEGKTPGETLSMQKDGTKVLRKLEDIPASYISYPPLSPVGRV